MALTIDELHSGIRYWRGSTEWPPDFHNEYYEHDLADIRTNGVFNQQWWELFYPILHDWVATRPCSRAFLTSRAQARFEALGARWASGVAPHLGSDIAGVEWHQLAAFPLLVAEIKPLKVPSPVFTAKFCHFLAPHVFPVTDKKAVGNRFLTYEECFNTARAEWLGTARTTQDELIKVLTHEVGKPPFGSFPMKCKLIELCMIGRRSRQRIH